MILGCKEDALRKGALSCHLIRSWHQSDNNHSAAAESLQSCPTLCDPIDSSPPGSSVPGILQARILEWVAISFSNACMHAKSLQVMSNSVRLHGQQPTRLLCPQYSLGKNTGVGCRFFLQITILVRIK